MDGLVTVVGLCIASGGVVAGARLLRWRGLVPPKSTPAQLTVNAGLAWAVTFVLLAYVVAVEGRSLGSIGVPPLPAEILVRPGLLALTTVNVVIPGAFGLVVVLPLAVGFGWLVQQFDLVPFYEVNLLLLAQPTHRKVFYAVTAGVTEEVLFRGYLLERALELTGSLVVAATLSVAVFALNHVPGRDLRGAIPVLAPGLGLVLVYLLTQNLLVVAVTHVAYDLLLLLKFDADDVLEAVEDHDGVDATDLDDRLVAGIDES
jgi:membrane protease YdiL (CAAX protease family)